MAQVLSSENLVEVMQNGGKAPEFTPPPKADKDIPLKVEKTTVIAEPREIGKPSSDGTTVQPRATDGTFQSPSGEKSPPESKEGKAPPQRADDKDPDGENLTEHARRVIGKKHRQMKEAEEFARTRDADAAAERARADYLQRELDELKGSKSGQGPAAGEGGSDPDEPKPEDFKTVGEYTRALTKYEVAKAAKAAGEQGARQSAEDRAKAAAEATTQAFVQRQEEFKQATPDYEQVLEDSELDMPNIGMQYLVESEMGPQLAYHLAKNPDVVNRLASLSPSRVIAELGKLEARLEDAAKVKDPPKGEAPTQQTRQVSRAPAPIQPLNTDASTRVHKDPSEMSFQELRAHREAERRAGKRM